VHGVHLIDEVIFHVAEVRVVLRLCPRPACHLHALKTSTRSAGKEPRISHHGMEASLMLVLVCHYATSSNCKGQQVLVLLQASAARRAVEQQSSPGRSKWQKGRRA